MSGMVRSKRKAKSGDPHLAVGYIRVSTDEQKLGPKGQMADLERWASREGVTLVAVFFDDGVSATRELRGRPALLGALAALGEVGAGVLVAQKRDRIGRKLGLTAAIEAEIRKAGAVLRTADGRSDMTGSHGVMSKGLDDVLAAWEREVISERTTAALAVKRARGERVGGVPYGMRLASDGKTLECDPVEQATVDHIRKSHANGVSMRRIVDGLNGAGVWARGSRWHLTTVARLLRA